MSPSFSVKGGVRYPFYVNSALLKGRKSQVGSVLRIPAMDIEATGGHCCLLTDAVGLRPALALCLAVGGGGNGGG
jgi:hypothetical protein